MASMKGSIKVWLLALALACGCAIPSSAATFSAKRGINLDIWTTWPGQETWGDRDALLPYPEWRKFLDAEDLAALRVDGFDFVRMPVDPAPFLSDKSAGLVDDLLASVRDSARMVNAAGLKVVVDLHSIPGRGIGTRELMDDPALFDRYVEVLRRMAKTLAAEDATMVALELMNEPTAPCETPEEARQWTGKLKRLFAAGRSSATRLTLVLTGACWSTADGLAAVGPKDFPDDNILWGFHAYDPFLLTHQGATWAGDFIPYVTGIPYPPYAVLRETLDAAVERIGAAIDAQAPWARRGGMKTYLDELIAGLDTKAELDAAMEKPFATVAAWMAQHGVRPEHILFGEFGMIRQEYQKPFVVPASERAAYLRDMIGHAERHGFAWAVWSYGGAFGVVDAFEGRKAEPEVLEMVRGLAR